MRCPTGLWLTQISWIRMEHGHPCDRATTERGQSGTESFGGTPPYTGNRLVDNNAIYQRSDNNEGNAQHEKGTARS